jgi:molybdopterin molybdotransferase
MLATVSVLDPEFVSIGQSCGRVVYEDVIASRDQPPFRSSAMDGYAIAVADRDSMTFSVVGESSAGRPFAGVLNRHDAVRIFTGAPVPAGAEIVIPQERARLSGDQLQWEPNSSLNSNVREIGIDFLTGDRLLRAGSRISSPQVALIAATGIPHIKVVRKPRIALLPTGTEIVRPGCVGSAYSMFDSITPALSLMIDEWGGEATQLDPLPDDIDSIVAMVRRVVDCVDLIVTVGGASVGKYDLIKQALSSLDLQIIVPRISIRPGKPTWFGTLGSRPILGLPGNATAAFVCSYVFLSPLIGALLRTSETDTVCIAQLDGELPDSGPNETYIRSSLHISGDARLIARPLANQDTSLVSVFAAAGALIHRRAGEGATGSGAFVNVILLRQPEALRPSAL